MAWGTDYGGQLPGVAADMPKAGGVAAARVSDGAWLRRVSEGSWWQPVARVTGAA